MKNYFKAVLLGALLFLSATVLSYAQDVAPSSGGTTQTPSKDKKEQKHHKKAPKKDTKKKKHKEKTSKNIASTNTEKKQ